MRGEEKSRQLDASILNSLGVAISARGRSSQQQGIITTKKYLHRADSSTHSSSSRRSSLTRTVRPLIRRTVVGDTLSLDARE